MPEVSDSPAKSAFVRAEEAAAALRRSLGGEVRRIAVILGSGLGEFADRLEDQVVIDYSDVPHFPKPTTVGHRGRLVRGVCAGVPVLALQGRFHYYEGFSLDEVVFPMRVLGRLGARLVVITNAAGGISSSLRPGDLMLMDDHLNLMGTNALRGANDDRFGPRFPDMSEVYPARLRGIVSAAAPASTELKHGVYAALPGPSYETPAEIRMLARLGADAVGMSTVPEATAAAHMGIQVVGVSGIANMAAGMVAGHRLSHTEVVDMMHRVGGKFRELLTAALPPLEEATGAR